MLSLRLHPYSSETSTALLNIPVLVSIALLRPSSLYWLCTANVTIEMVPNSIFFVPLPECEYRKGYLNNNMKIASSGEYLA